MSNETAVETKKGKGGLIGFVLLAVLALGGGAAVPWFLSPRTDVEGDDSHGHGGHGNHGGHGGHGASGKTKTKKAGDSPEAKQAVLTFGDVVVNLGEERLNRYLRAKILLVVDDEQSKEVNDLLTKQKPFLKSWLLSYLSDQTVSEVSRMVGQNRLRREIRDQFNHKLFPDGAEKIQEVLLDEFMVQ